VFHAPASCRLQHWWLRTRRGRPDEHWERCSIQTAYGRDQRRRISGGTWDGVTKRSRRGQRESFVRGPCRPSRRAQHPLRLRRPHHTPGEREQRWLDARSRGSEVLKRMETEARNALTAAALPPASRGGRTTPLRGWTVFGTPTGWTVFQIPSTPGHVPSVRCDVCGRDWERRRGRGLPRRSRWPVAMATRASAPFASDGPPLRGALQD